MNSKKNYSRNIAHLQKSASIFWPVRLSEEAFNRSIIPLLLDTQDEFIALLNVPVSSIEKLCEVIDISTFPPNLFLKHLIVLTDLGGEMLQRINKFFDSLFPQGELVYEQQGESKSYQFHYLPIKGTLNNKRLHIDGKNLLKKQPMSPLLRDVIALLIYGSACTNERAANVLEKCVINQYLGRPNELTKYITQRYIWVSKITSGAKTNTLGHLAEEEVREYLQLHLNVEGAKIGTNGFLPNVSHRDEKSKNQKPTTFDIVVSKGKKYVGVEVSFQVTTNSVIERKGREALSIFNKVERAGHKIAYVIDGAGNFMRITAVTNICDNSHCTVAFAESEFEILVDFIRGHLLAK